MPFPGETLRRLCDALPGGRLRRAIRNADRPSAERPGEHWAIARFPSASQPWEPGGRVCPLGSRTRGAHLQGRFDVGFDVTTTIPADEEYTEWTDLLEAVLDAGPAFTFVDIGSGYGRWASRAAAAARIAGKTLRLTVVEADPKNVVRLKEHMADNEIEDYRLIEAAVGLERRRSYLAVAPSGEAEDRDWFGQRIGWGELWEPPVVGEHFGRPLYEVNDWRFVQVDEIPLTDVLAGLGFVDLLDMDIQGAEADAVTGAVEALTATTRRAHIETHTADAESVIRRVMAGAGWRCLRDYPCLQENDTPFGRFYMEGGVQTWVNPRRL